MAIVSFVWWGIWLYLCVVVCFVAFLMDMYRVIRVMEPPIGIRSGRNVWQPL